jgi:hypothetical protein
VKQTLTSVFFGCVSSAVELRLANADSAVVATDRLALRFVSRRCSVVYHISRRLRIFV